MTDLLIRNATVFTLTDTPPAVRLLATHDVLIRGQRIEAVQPTGQADPSHFAQVIDASGLLVMPGLINTHAHVPMVIFRGLAEDVSIDRWFNEFMWPLESNLQPEDVYWGMQLGIAEMLKAGVTTFADHYFYLDRGAAAVEQAGVRALLGWAVFGSQGQPALDLSERFVRDYEGAADGRIRTVLAPHAPYTCDDDFLRACAHLADRLGVGIHIHAAETPEQTRASLDKHGVTPIQALARTGILATRGVIIAHGCGLTPDDIPLLAAASAGVAHAPKTYLKLAMDLTPIPALRAAGVPVGLATDGAVSNNTLDLWEALRLTAMLQKDRARAAEALPIPEALSIATRESARVIAAVAPQMGAQIGAVAPGYLADLILIDLSGTHHQPLHSVSASLVYNMQPSDVRTVIVDGRVVMRDRRLLTLDEGEITAQVRESMARLAQRVPDRRIQTYNP